MKAHAICAVILIAIPTDATSAIEVAVISVVRGSMIQKIVTTARIAAVNAMKNIG